MLQVRGGKRVHELPPEFDTTVVVHGRGLRDLRSAVVRAAVPVFRAVHTTVLWGETGLGKTRFAVANRSSDEVCLCVYMPVLLLHTVCVFAGVPA